MSFFSDIVDSLTGKAQRDYSVEQLRQQLGFSTGALNQQGENIQAALDEMLAEAKLQYSPEQIKMRQKIYVTAIIVFGIIILIWIKKS